VLFFYPNQGQSEEQQDRDQYECYLWATQQTGFDPSNPNLAPHHRVEFVHEPASRHGTALGAAAGAVIGAAVTSRSNPAKGAVVGAVAGAMLGAASDASREEEARRRQQQYDQETADRYAESEIKANNYRRAQEACLEGRGYTVR
jgi:Ser/Thr protein kinase RdoA (MazF antagonist)